MGRNVARQIQPAVRRQTTGDADASASNERRDTERITARTVAKAKRRLRTKPEKRPARAKGAAEEKHTEAAVPFEQIVVGEREGEPNYKKPGQSSSQDENRNTNTGDDAPSEHPSPVADARAVQNPRDAQAQAQAQAQAEAPPFVPEPLPRGAHRPYVPRLEEVLFGLDGICVYDAQMQAQVDDIGRLIMVLRHKEAEVAQKVRDVQRTRIVVEKLYTSRVKLDPSLIGQGDSEGEGESGGEEREEERPEGGADDHDQPPQVARSKAVTNGKRRAVDPTAGPPEVEGDKTKSKAGAIAVGATWRRSQTELHLPLCG
uniref:Uncharacterized protein n=1 Tax=Ganoderma boninense TaxID=34458 RepID=A0A5K1JYY1_9APHY|nr:Uncharacterized protein [Ganoderma boninense]